MIRCPTGPSLAVWAAVLPVGLVARGDPANPVQLEVRITTSATCRARICRRCGSVRAATSLGRSPRRTGLLSHLEERQACMSPSSIASPLLLPVRTSATHPSARPRAEAVVGLSSRFSLSQAFHRRLSVAHPIRRARLPRLAVRRIAQQPRMRPSRAYPPQAVGTGQGLVIRARHLLALLRPPTIRPLYQPTALYRAHAGHASPRPQAATPPRPPRPQRQLPLVSALRNWPTQPFQMSPPAQRNRRAHPAASQAQRSTALFLGATLSSLGSSTYAPTCAHTRTSDPLSVQHLVAERLLRARMTPRGTMRRCT